MTKFFLTLASVLLAAIAQADDRLNPVVLNQHVLDQYATWDFALSESGKPWFAYYGVDNLLY
jgi:hypothetical protein